MDKSHFGFKQVDTNAKVSLVQKVFSQVAKNYDLMNDVMSMGVHRLWKKELIKTIKNPYGDLLDCASGTGDIATLYYKNLKGFKANITACDLNPDMLKVGKDKLIDQNIINKFNYVCANAEELPFADNSFDNYTIAFGIRNVTNIKQALSEAYRVLKPGGQFLCLEFSHIDNLLFKQFYDFYSFHLITLMGKIIAKDEDSYKYLVESIRMFPKQQEFKSIISETGFKNVSYSNLTLGIAAIHTGWKI